MAAEVVPSYRLLCAVLGIGGSNRIKVKYGATTTLWECKQRVARKLGVTADRIKVIVAGKVLDDSLNDRPLLSFNLSRMSVTHISVRASAEPGSSTEVAVAPAWTPPAFQPLPPATPRPPLLINQDTDLAHLILFVWCFEHDSQSPTHAHTILPQAAIDGIPYPTQLQRGKVRLASCSRCNANGGFIEIDTNVTSWAQLLRADSGDSDIIGRCNACHQQTPVLLTLGCQGSKVSQAARSSTQVELEHQRCGAFDKLTVKPLPGVILNTTEEPSIDSMMPDQIQVVAHPCGHRVSVEGMTNYLQTFTREYVVRNDFFPNELGEYALACSIPNCDGVLYLPTLRLAGSVIYERIKQWGSIEAILEQNGVLCPTCRGAYLPPDGETGPKRRCPLCKSQFCQLHHMLWSDCSCSSIRQSIEEILTFEGLVQRCYACHLPGSKNPYCTHISCLNVECRTRFCYWCTGPLPCRNRCPMYLQSVPMIETPDAGQAMANFHRLKSLRLLRESRARSSPQEWDSIFNTMPAAMRTIQISVNDDDLYHSAPIIKLADVLSTPATAPAGQIYPHP